MPIKTIYFQMCSRIRQGIVVVRCCCGGAPVSGWSTWTVFEDRLMNELGCKCSLEQQEYVLSSVCLLKSGHCGLTCCAVSPRTIIQLTLISLNPPQPWLRLCTLTTKLQTAHPLTHWGLWCCAFWASPRPKNRLHSSDVHTQHLFIKYTPYVLHVQSDSW